MNSNIPKIISRIAATTFLIAISFIVLSPFWFWVSLETVAVLLVAIGCSGEWYLHHHPAGRQKREKDDHHKLESRFIGAVALGVTMEIFALGHSIREGVRLDDKISQAELSASTAKERAAVAEKEAALANERAGLANKIAGQSNERAAIIESNNAVVSLQIEVLRTKNSGLEAKALELQEQIIRTSNNVVKADPLNRPIKSMKADVYLVIRATNKFEADLSKVSPSLKGLNLFSPKSLNAVLILPKDFVFGKDSALAGLRCNEYESRPHVFPSSGTAYSMSFSWPTGGWWDMFDSTNNVSVNELREKIGNMEISMVGIEKHSEISEGSCILTINGSIQERFSVPKFTDEHSVNCPLIRTNIP